ncbi:MAG: FHA domain-containing protein [Candidatus Eremiobacteraeota bacterium]|nr:FHA domain-containing protein [Candidatus Eremiobacteraeota bacterium]MCW5867513.1 FHA domain-containing protein [Candidatus Eremiobacteraeota bacterium]
MEREVFKALTGGLGLAGKLVGRSVDEVAKVVKGADDHTQIVETGLYHLPQSPSAPMAPRARWLETQASSRLNVNLLKGLTMSAGEKEFIEGLRFMLQGRIPQAVESLREAARRSESKIQVTDAYFVLGALLLHDGQAEEASRHFHTALMAQQGLGRGLKRWCPTFHVSLSLTDYSAFALGPDLIGLTVALALSQFHRSPEEAIHTLDQLLELVPGEPTGQFFAGLLRYRLGLDREVFALLQKSLPDSNVHLAGLLLLGLSCARLGDPATARELFKKAMQRQDLDATLANDLRVGLANATSLAGSPREAEAELASLRLKSPHYVTFEQRWGLQTPEPVAEPEPEPEVVEAPKLRAADPEPPANPVSVIDISGSASRLVCVEKNIEVSLSTAPFVIGREADVSLPDDTAASRQHARITKADGDYWVEDLGSTNGTWVNRHRIRRMVELHRGDIIEIGEHRFEIR